MDVLTGKQLNVIVKFKEHCVPLGYQIKKAMVDTLTDEINQYWIIVESKDGEYVCQYLFDDESHTPIQQRVTKMNGEHTYNDKYEATGLHYYNHWSQE